MIVQGLPLLLLHGYRDSIGNIPGPVSEFCLNDTDSEAGIIGSVFHRLTVCRNSRGFRRCCVELPPEIDPSLCHDLFTKVSYTRGIRWDRAGSSGVESTSQAFNIS
ncbi:hypothetical protein SDC9_170803 [bioreactor metagenome]|uniref:Uncharacterized protein n=1 Tax=bioreactor metagenome TaxID=1076179 RepID=A0A645G9U6_9ZZZZ